MAGVASHTFLASHSGTLVVPLSARFPGLPLGRIPYTGTLAALVPMPSLGVTTHRQLFLQGVVVGRRGGFLGNPMHVLLLDREGGVDCNANLVMDVFDVIEGTSSDSNGDLVPDECAPAPLTLYVDAAASPGGNGSVAAPYLTLADGMAAALSGDTVMVCDGTYTGPGNHSVSFDGKDIIVMSKNGPGSCIIDCAGLGRAFSLTQGETTTARIQGFTIMNGAPDAAFGPEAEYGGAIYAFEASVSISGCAFVDCAAQLRAGGVFVGHGDALIDNCTFAGNDAFRGGALYLESGESRVLRCSFTENSAGGEGGALYFGGGGLSSTANISHSSFIGNTSSILGGGAILVAFSSSDLSLDNCLIAGNVGRNGGGVFATGGDLVFTNCTVVDNSAIGIGQGGGGFDVTTSTSLVLTNSLLWGNTASQGSQLLATASSTLVILSHCSVEGGATGIVNTTGAGTSYETDNNTSADPLFVDADGADNDPLTLADNNYRLGAGSLCIDRGDNGAIPPEVSDVDGDLDVLESVPIDLDGNPRQVDDPAVADQGTGQAPLVDLGAFEQS